MLKCRRERQASGQEEHVESEDDEMSAWDFVSQRFSLQGKGGRDSKLTRVKLMDGAPRCSLQRNLCAEIEKAGASDNGCGGGRGELMGAGGVWGGEGMSLGGRLGSSGVRGGDEAIGVSSGTWICVVGLTRPPSPLRRWSLTANQTRIDKPLSVSSLRDESSSHKPLPPETKYFP